MYISIMKANEKSSSVPWRLVQARCRWYCLDCDSVAYIRLTLASLLGWRSSSSRYFGYSLTRVRQSSFASLMLSSLLLGIILSPAVAGFVGVGMMSAYAILGISVSAVLSLSIWYLRFRLCQSSSLLEFTTLMQIFTFCLNARQTRTAHGLSKLVFANAGCRCCSSSRYCGTSSA